MSVQAHVGFMLAAVLFPAWWALEARVLPRAADPPTARRAESRGAFWSTTWLSALVLMPWLSGARPLAELGLGPGSGGRSFVGWGLAALVVLALAAQVLVVARRPEAHADVRRQLEAAPGSELHLLSGTLWPGVVAHAAIDAGAGALARVVRLGESEEGGGPTASSGRASNPDARAVPNPGVRSGH